MISFRFLDGRNVDLSALHVLSTYSQMRLQGNPRQELDERIPELVRQYFPFGDPPFVVRWPEASSIPTTLCLGSFISQAVALDPAEGYSFLIIVWFVWHVDRSIREIVGPGLAGLKWGEHAQDFSWW